MELRGADQWAANISSRYSKPLYSSFQAVFVKVWWVVGLQANTFQNPGLLILLKNVNSFVPMKPHFIVQVLPTEKLPIKEKY